MPLVSGIGENALDLTSDGRLDIGDDGLQRMAIIRVTWQGLGVERELAARRRSVLSFANGNISGFGGSTRRMMSSYAPPLGTTLLLTDGSPALPTLLTIGSLLLPERP